MIESEEKFCFEKEKKKKKLLSKEEIKELLHGTSEIKPEWIVNNNMRKEKFFRILHDGNREELLVLIKSVYLHEKKPAEEGGKRLHVVDKNAMKQAEKMLYEEFAYVFNLERKEVLLFILREIEAKH